MKRKVALAAAVVVTLAAASPATAGTDAAVAPRAFDAAVSADVRVLPRAVGRCGLQPRGFRWGPAIAGRWG